jgi:hypothetical protein
VFLSAQLIDNKIVPKGCLSLTHNIEIFLQRYEFAGTKRGAVVTFLKCRMLYQNIEGKYTDKNKPTIAKVPRNGICPN